MKVQDRQINLINLSHLNKKYFSKIKEQMKIQIDKMTIIAKNINKSKMK